MKFQFNRKTLSAVALAGMMLGGSAYAVANDDNGPPPPGDFGHGGPHGHHHGGGPLMHELKQLDLTDAQRETIKGYVQASRENERSSFEAMHTVRRTFDTTVPNSAGYGTVVEQMADAAATAARAHVQKEAALRTQIYSVLTDAQKSRLASDLASLPEPPARPR